ncbi:MAG: elongation factor P [Candidatus Zixiibacteriota bacterium]|nr:MAG: elongation factor P [candidate division Zixibacteria bacterium]
MISTSNFRKGMKLALDGELFIIVDFLNQKIGRGGAKMWTKLKNLKTGQVLERTFRGGETFEDPDFNEQSMQYLYNEDEIFHFMDSRTYEQFALTIDQVGDYKWYLQENTEYKILFFEGAPISINMPPSVVLEIIEADPGVKGDSVSNLTKNAVVETGLKIKVPLFIKVGEKIKIDTSEGKYLERVN